MLCCADLHTNKDTDLFAAIVSRFVTSLPPPISLKIRWTIIDTHGKFTKSMRRLPLQITAHIDVVHCTLYTYTYSSFHSLTSHNRFLTSIFFLPRPESQYFSYHSIIPFTYIEICKVLLLNEPNVCARHKYERSMFCCAVGARCVAIP